MEPNRAQKKLRFSLLSAFFNDNGIKPEDRIFPVTYAAARIVFKKAGDLVGIHLKPHDLRRHAATYARATV
jgi:integrase/recombinase XerD